MKKLIIIFISISITVFGKDLSFEYEGIPISVLDAKGKSSHIIVKRDIPEKCRKVPMTNEMLWTGNYANPKVPKECTSNYVHTTGKLQHIRLEHDVGTYGEL